MVDKQIVRRGVRDTYVLDAMRAVLHEEFVSPEMAEIRPGERVLEVGAGSGYAAAIMSRIAGHVHAIGRHAALGEDARDRLERLGYDNIDLRGSPCTKGWPEAAPFEAIL